MNEAIPSAQPFKPVTLSRVGLFVPDQALSLSLLPGFRNVEIQIRYRSVFHLSQGERRNPF
jgi:hypothetical protein